MRFRPEEHHVMVAELAKDPQKIAEFLLAHRKITNALHAAMIISKEAGELLDAVYRLAVYENEFTEQVYDNIVEELGDIEFGMSLLRQQIGVARDTTIAANTAKLNKRYAEGKFSDAQATARADKVEIPTQTSPGVANMDGYSEEDNQHSDADIHSSEATPVLKHLKADHTAGTSYVDPNPHFSNCKDCGIIIGKSYVRCTTCQNKLLDVLNSGEEETKKSNGGTPGVAFGAPEPITPATFQQDKYIVLTQYDLQILQALGYTATFGVMLTGLDAERRRNEKPRRNYVVVSDEFPGFYEEIKEEYMKVVAETLANREKAAQEVRIQDMGVNHL
jgi:hypothetical protein